MPRSFETLEISRLLASLATEAGHPTICLRRGCRRARRCLHLVAGTDVPCCRLLLIDGEPEQHEAATDLITRLGAEYRPGRLAAWLRDALEAGENPELAALAVRALFGALGRDDPAWAEFRSAVSPRPVANRHAPLWKRSRSGTESRNETADDVDWQNSSSI